MLVTKNMNIAFTKHEIPKSCFYEVMTFQIPDTIIPGAFSFLSLFRIHISILFSWFPCCPVQVEPCRRQTSPVPTFAHSGPYRPFPPSGLDWTFTWYRLIFRKEDKIFDPLLTAVTSGKLACPCGYSGPCFRSTYFDRL